MRSAPIDKEAPADEAGAGEEKTESKSDINSRAEPMPGQDFLAHMAPKTLRATPHWLVRGDDKIPHYLDGSRRRGEQGSAEDRARLGTFEQALDTLKSGQFSGLGFAMLPDAGLVALDFDRCIDERGRVAQWVLDLAKGTYAERSPSGRGVRAFYKGALPDFKNHAEGVEVFHAKGYVTVTGNALPDATDDVQPLPDSICAALDSFRPGYAPGIYEEGGDRDAPYLATEIGEPALTHLRQALDFIPSDERDLWTRFAHALKPLGSLGEQLWVDWSEKSAKFNRRDALRVWRSVRSSRIGYKTVLAAAYRAGWSGPRGTAAAPIVDEDWPACLDLNAMSRQSPALPQFIIPDWLPCGYATLMAGHGGVGKSGIALHLAACISLGRDFFGVVTSERRVLYVSCEDRASVLHWRLKRICDFEAVALNNLAEKLEIVDLVGHDSVLYNRDPRTGETLAPAYPRLANRMRDLRTEVLIVDGISDAFGGNENSKVDVKQFVNSLLALIPAERGAVLLIGHVAKPIASAPNTSEGYSGTTGWHNAARARWYLFPETEPGDDWGGRLTRTGHLQLELQKSNYGAADQAMRFRWDERAHLFVGTLLPSSANPLQRIAQEALEKQGILDAGRAAIRKGLSVPAASTGPKTALHVLSAEKVFPATLRGPQHRKRFWRLVRELLSEQVIRHETYISSSRHLQQRMVFS